MLTLDTEKNYLLFYLLDDMNVVYGGRRDLCNVYVNLSNLKKSDINMICLFVLLLLFFSCFTGQLKSFLLQLYPSMSFTAPP